MKFINLFFALAPLQITNITCIEENANKFKPQNTTINYYTIDTIIKQLSTILQSKYSNEKTSSPIFINNILLECNSEKDKKFILYFLEKMHSINLLNLNINNIITEQGDKSVLFLDNAINEARSDNAPCIIIVDNTDNNGNNEIMDVIYKQLNHNNTHEHNTILIIVIDHQASLLSQKNDIYKNLFNIILTLNNNYNQKKEDAQQKLLNQYKYNELVQVQEKISHDLKKHENFLEQLHTISTATNDTTPAPEQQKNITEEKTITVTELEKKIEPVVEHEVKKEIEKIEETTVKKTEEENKSQISNEINNPNDASSSDNIPSSSNKFVK